MNGEMILDAYYPKIKAVYSFMSSITTFSSFLGLPSYTFYRYIVNQSGRKRFDSYFEHSHVQLEFVYHISQVNEIGKIDNQKMSKNLPFIDLSNVPETYRALLNI